MWNIISVMQKKLTLSIPISMMLGILTGYFGDPAPLKIFIIPLTFLMVYPMMVNIEFKKLFNGGDLKLQSITQIINFGIIPFIALATGKIFFPQNHMAAFGLLLASLLPTSGMTISWTGFAKGNINAAIKMTIIGLVAGSLITPFYGKWLMGTLVEIPLFEIFKQISFIVFMPMILGAISRIALIRYYGIAVYQKDVKQKFPLLSTIGVLGIVFVAMALKSKSILTDPQQFFYLFIPLAVLYGLNFAISTIVARTFFKRDDAIALVYGTVMRNLSIALAIAMVAFGAEGTEIALIISVAYIIQVQAGAWYVKFTDRIFGVPGDTKVESVMNEGIFALQCNATLLDSIKLLDEEHIHSIAVLNSEDKPAGMLSSAKIISLIADGIKPETTLDKIKLDPVITVESTGSLKDAVNKMKRSHQYKVLVVDENNQFVGVLTESDILKDFLLTK